MGVCDSLFGKQKPPYDKNGIIENDQKVESNNIQNISNNKKKGNYFRSSIGDSLNMNNFNNLSKSQSLMTGNDSIYSPQKKNLFKYVNKYEQNGNLQISLATGSLQRSNNYSSITSGNKGESRSSDNYLSTSKSFGEFIVDGKINQNMKDDKDFNNFMDMEKDNIGESGISSDENKTTNTNKKDVNYYSKKKSNNINGNKLKEIEERNREEESSETPPLEPLDTIV